MNPHPKTLIIAEAGVNHNGSVDRALKLVDCAADCGADIVKFQTFKAGKLVSKNAKKADYQARNTGDNNSQHEMLQKLELSDEAHAQLIGRAKERGIEFLSTPFDTDSADLLIQRFKLSKIKISSGDLDNSPLLLHIARTDKPMILSTGMATLADIETALGVVAFGYLNSGEAPSKAAFSVAYASPEGRHLLQERVSLLHCTTEYPAPFNEVNLRAMKTLRIAFGLTVGFSDHTPGISVPIAAVAMGASIIEKHFTLDTTLPGPDHLASLSPLELKAMVDGIRQVEVAMGTSIKAPTKSEAKNRVVARKSLVAARAIAVGEIFSPENLTVKRPGDGISPIDYWGHLGRASSCAYETDDLVRE